MVRRVPSDSSTSRALLCEWNSVVRSCTYSAARRSPILGSRRPVSISMYRLLSSEAALPGCEACRPVDSGPADGLESLITAGISLRLTPAGSSSGWNALRLPVDGAGFGLGAGVPSASSGSSTVGTKPVIESEAAASRSSSRTRARPESSPSRIRLICRPRSISENGLGR